MGSTARFDWDHYLETAPYGKVLDGVRGCGSTPTMFSPDRKLIYLRTCDLAFSTDDTAPLNRQMAEILNELETETILSRWSYKRLYLLETDYLTIWGLLNERNALPEDYQFPEFYLERAMTRRMQKLHPDLQIDSEDPDV